MTSEEFAGIVADWLAKARHPKLARPYTECVYQPMLELLAYLRANGFKTFIVSGGGIEFMRPWTERVYGVPPEQVVGSSAQTRYELRGGKPAIVRLPALDFVDDKAGKPVGINKFIGRRPIAAFGNSDGDFEMLEWTTSGPGPRFGAIVHHDDAEREVRLRPHVLRRPPRPRPRRGPEARLDARQHEARLEEGVPERLTRPPRALPADPDMLATRRNAMSTRTVQRVALALMLGVTAFQATACFGPFRRHERREDRRDDRQDRREDRRDDRQDRRDDRQDDRRERWD